MNASEVIKHELPRLAAELEAKGYLIKTFERSGQINVYLSGQVVIYYVTTGRIVMHKERGFSAFLKLLEETK